MKYIISVLLLLSTLQVIAHEWNTYQYKDKYSVSVPSTIELRRENDTYTQLLNDIQGNIIGFQVTSTSNNSTLIMYFIGIFFCSHTMKEGVVSSLINSQASPNTHSYNKESPHLMV